MKERPRVLISLCLLGAACRYDGGGNRCDGLEALMERCELIPVCPEQLGGLPTPRTPCERTGDRVVARDGADVTAEFRRGAAQAAQLAARFGARYAVLKSGSPSCGVREIYDGSFTGTRIPGMGVAAEALRGLGVALYDERQIDELMKRIEGDDA